MPKQMPDQIQEQAAYQDPAPRELTFFGKVLRALLPLLLILSGGAAWSYFKATAPVMKKSRPQRAVTVVETMPAALTNARAQINAMGTVTAAKSVTLKAQVSGVVQSVPPNFMPGSLVKKGEVLVRLDPSDYEVSVRKARSALADATAALAIEQGSQTIAREELKLLTQISEDRVDYTDLALRKPQLAQAQADVASARADLDQALLNLKRTTITAPFNAMIMARSVNEGAYVGAQTELVTLVGTDVFWVEAMVPLDQVAYIDPSREGGAPAEISSQAGPGTWQGRVIQTAGKLNDVGRMATVIVAVENPLGTREHPAAVPLMVSDYVTVSISGRTLAGVVALPRAALQDDNTLWINRDSTLDIRRVSLAWKDRTRVYLASGVLPGEEIITSGLAVPVQGMPLKTLAAARQVPAETIERHQDVKTVEKGARTRNPAGDPK